MKRGLLLGAIGIATCLFIAIGITKRQPDPNSNEALTTIGPIDRSAEATVKPQFTNALNAHESALVEQLGKRNQTSISDVLTIGSIWQSYSRQVGALPYGDSRAWARALLGENAKQASFFPENHPSVNENRELVDSWGTPFNYHVKSRNQIEVTSAGPDLRFYTEDDIKPRTHR